MSDRDTTIIVRDKRSGGWSWYDHKVLFCPYFNGNDFKTYCGLSAHADNHSQQSYPSIATLAAKLNMSRTTVIRSLKVLIECGAVQKEKLVGGNNTYTLIDFDELHRPQRVKSKSEHHQFIEFFYDTAKKTRNVTVKFSKGDTKRLKDVITSGVMTSTQMEQIALYFLADPALRKFTPSITVLFSNGILTALMNTMENDGGEFWKRLGRYTDYLKDTDHTIERKAQPAQIKEAMRQLAEKFNLNKKES